MKNITIHSLVFGAILTLSGCGEEISSPTCADLKVGNKSLLDKQQQKYPEQFAMLKQKCPNQNSQKFQPSTATQGLVQ